MRRVLCAAVCAAHMAAVVRSFAVTAVVAGRALGASTHSGRSRCSSCFRSPAYGGLNTLARSGAGSYQLRRTRHMSLQAEVSSEGAVEESQEVAEPAFKANLLTMSKAELETLLQSWGQPKYRAAQVLEAAEQGKAFADMQNLPKALRQQLEENVQLGSLSLAAEQVSKDGTRKRAYALCDGQLIESVLMPYSDGRRTACISSQAGCAMGCVFCATGQMGFARQLTADEIFEQAFRFASELRLKGERLSNVVFMGMGEPLANYANVMEAVRRINSQLGIGARHITISTVGLVPRIQRLAQEDLQVKLAVSLHAANDKERSALLPVNRRFPLAELMDACKAYVDQSGRRMTFEWALIHGENDSRRTAEELGRLLAPLRGMCHVNVIPLNPTQGFAGGPAQAAAVAEFVDTLARHSVPATPRVRRGIDIDAGCGQLTASVQRDKVLGKGL
eukprot:TRINITY_DN3253_c1_g1_i7.p1 TRINITY_DN3253_c1_g1~~TRINITY_DN3253_c1_g1_i7.p1  ORF type:complete len:458 (-),score=149.58 TRINITY_DN3253_c1_g1_i7:30-1373(-)